MYMCSYKYSDRVIVVRVVVFVIVVGSEVHCYGGGRLMRYSVSQFNDYRQICCVDDMGTSGRCNNSCHVICLYSSSSSLSVTYCVEPSPVRYIQIKNHENKG